MIREVSNYEPDIEEFWGYKVFLEFEMDGPRECAVTLMAKSRSDAEAAVKAMFPSCIRMRARRL